MVDRWVQDHQKDAWRKQAKASGYRARSAFKLKQIQERHKIIDSQDSVLDVGCHPGGWAQVAHRGGSSNPVSTRHCGVFFLYFVARRRVLQTRELKRVGRVRCPY